MNNQEIIALLVAARVYVECCCEDDRSDPASEVLAQIDAVLTKLEAQL